MNLGKRRFANWFIKVSPETNTWKNELLAASFIMVYDFYIILNLDSSFSLAASPRSAGATVLTCRRVSVSSKCHNRCSCKGFKVPFLTLQGVLDLPMNTWTTAFRRFVQVCALFTLVTHAVTKCLSSVCLHLQNECGYMNQVSMCVCVCVCVCDVFNFN